MPTPQDIWKKGLKLPSVCNCFTLTMTNELVVIINRLKVPKIKKILLYEMKFLVPNYSCLQNPCLGGYCPQIPVPCPQLNFLKPPPPPKQNSWVYLTFILGFYKYAGIPQFMCLHILHLIK
jgi:hypothetical protein